MLLLLFLLHLVFSHSHSHGGSCPHHTKKTQSQPGPTQTPLQHPHYYDFPIQIIQTYAPSFNISPEFFGTIISVLFVGIFPIIMLLFLPVGTDSAGKHLLSQSFLHVLLAFAAGGLLGDVFLHLIPHALHSHTPSSTLPHTKSHAGHSHSHAIDSHDHTDHTLVGLYVLGGIFLFFIIEKSVLLLSPGHSHGHSHAPPTATQAIPPADHRTNTTALLNVIADIVHNFTDGMAIAASFQVSLPLGITTTIAVLIHEIPHEIGDMAVLLKSGVHFRNVILLQVGTAVGAVLGAIVGFEATAGRSELTRTVILPITAGGFIYVATVGIIPKLFDSLHSLRQTIFESIAMMSGVGIMLAIAFFFE